MALITPTFDEMVEGIRRGVAEAVREAHARGLPVFETDDSTVYAIYPDGRRVAVERIPEASRQTSSKAEVTAPDLVILAGANGVGKTTFARSNLQAFVDQHAFLNADDIARHVNPSDVEAVAVEAGRRTLLQRRGLLERRHPFCVETTLATRTLLRFIDEAKTVGFRAKPIFLFTPFAYINELRVKQRVMAADTTSVSIPSAVGTHSASSISPIIGKFAPKGLFSTPGRMCRRRYCARMNEGHELSILLAGRCLRPVSKPQAASRL